MLFASYFRKQNLILLCCIPTLFLAFVLYKNFINIPTGDDIYVLEMFNLLKDADSWEKKLSILFAQHNEHRIVITRLFALFQYHLCGYIDLRWWLIVGNMCLIFMTWLFFLNLKNSPWLIIPVAFVLICPASNTFYAMQNANLFSVVFSLASLHFSLSEQEKKIPLFTFLFTLLAIFSNGGGFIGLVIISGVFFFQKRYPLLAFWLLFGVLILSGYFFNYQKIYRHSSWHFLFEQLPQAFQFLLAFLGSIAFLPKLTLITGAVFIGVGLYAFYRHYYLQNPFVFLCLIYGLSMAGLTSMTRYEHGLSTALSERYAIYSMLLAACMVIIVYDLFEKHIRYQKYVYGALCLLSVSLNLKYVTLHLRNPEERKLLLESKIENYHLNNSGFNCLEISTLNKLTKNGFYDYQLKKPIHSQAYYDSLNRPTVERITVRIDTFYQSQENLHFRGTMLNAASQIEAINQIHHRLIVIHHNATPFDCTKNELTAPQNNETVILDMELENNHHHVTLPTFAFSVPKNIFSRENIPLFPLNE
ncbi:MAG: hypothetical protein R2822_13155 [Spirosomataceae bacterium]